MELSLRTRSSPIGLERVRIGHPIFHEDTHLSLQDSSVTHLQIVTSSFADRIKEEIIVVKRTWSTIPKDLVSLSFHSVMEHVQHNILHIKWSFSRERPLARGNITFCKSQTLKMFFWVYYAEALFTTGNRFRLFFLLIAKWNRFRPFLLTYP